MSILLKMVEPAGPEHLRGRLEIGSHLLDERHEHENHERDDRNEVHEDDARDPRREVEFVAEHREGNSVRHRRHDHREEEKRDERALTLELGTGQRVRGRECDEERDDDVRDRDGEGHGEKVRNVMVGGDVRIPFPGEEFGQWARVPPLGYRIEDHGHQDAHDVEHVDRDCNQEKNT